MLLHAPPRLAIARFANSSSTTQFAKSLRSVPTCIPCPTGLSHGIACRVSSNNYTPPQQSQPQIQPQPPSTSPQPDSSDNSSQPSNPLVRAILWLRACVQGALLVLLPTLQHRKRLAAGISMLFVSALMVAAGVVGVASRGGPTAPSAPREVVYSQFRDLLTQGRIRAVRFDEASARIYFDTLAAGGGSATPQQASTSALVPATATTTRPRIPRQYYTKRIYDPNLVNALLAAGVEFGAMQAGLSAALVRTLGTVLALWLPLLPMYIIMRKVLEGRLGNRRKREDVRSRAPPVTFADVAGVDSAKEELMEVVACLRDSQRYARLNAKTPSGVLLCGPPGTGKTLLAKAVAGEAGVPFFAASASEFVEMFVGRGAARIRDLFREARKAAPCVVFIDELDAVGGRRGVSLNEERDQTLNQLLTELDGFEGRPGVVLLAATNRPEVLDPALTRPGRLSRKVVVPLPDEQARAEILAVHLRDVPMASPSDKVAAAQQIARITRGFSGAELANVVNEAALLTGRQGLEVIGLRELLDAVQRTRFGVNGGSQAFLPVRGLQKRLLDWAADVAATPAPPARAGTQ